MLRLPFSHHPSSPHARPARSSGGRLAAAVVCLALVAALAPSPVDAQQRCVPFLSYVDLWGGGSIENLPNLVVLQKPMDLPIDPNLPLPAGCSDDPWKSALLEITIPPQCKELNIWVEYEGQPRGWTLNVGDSETNNGFGGDAGTLPAGSNAELQVLDQRLSVYNGGDAPEKIYEVVRQSIDLTDGALKVTVVDDPDDAWPRMDEIVWGPSYHRARGTNQAPLIRLPRNPVPPDNRVVYVAFNRTVSNGTSRIGCGVRRAVVSLQ